MIQDTKAEDVSILAPLTEKFAYYRTCYIGITFSDKVGKKSTKMFKL